MATLTKDPDVKSGPTEQGEASAAQRQNPRVLLTVAALLAGLSVAVPAVMMVLVRPLNGASIDMVDGEWVGALVAARLGQRCRTRKKPGTAGPGRDWGSGRGVAASDPADTRNWVLAVALFAFVSVLLGNLFTIPLFAFLAMHNV